MSDDAGAIDLMHLGRPRVICAWVVGDVIVDPGPTSCLDALLDGLEGMVPRALLLTHIHLDHAGATGSLVRRWPELEVHVHERGARHMIDPSRLLASATQLYGEDMDRLWGEFVPVPEERIRVLRGGEQLFGDDGFTVAYTPGHASHHVSYLHDGIAFVGDVGGVRITPAGPSIPPTPPPDIDLGQWQDSISLIEGWQPRRLAMTHFGASDEVTAQLEEVGSRLERWADLVRHAEFPAFDAAVRSEIEDLAEPGSADAYAQAAPRDQLYAGLRRYWAKLDATAS